MTARETLDQLAEDPGLRRILANKAARFLSRTNAEDVVQDAFLRTYRYVHKIRNPERTKRVLYVIFDRVIASYIGRIVTERVAMNDWGRHSHFAMMPDQLNALIDKEKELILTVSIDNPEKPQINIEIGKLLLAGHTRKELKNMGYSACQIKNAKYRFGQAVRLKANRRMTATWLVKKATA